MIDRSNRVAAHQANGVMAGPDTATWYAEELETVPEDQPKSQEVLLAELIRALQQGDPTFVEQFVNCGGAGALFSVAAKWTMFGFCTENGGFYAENDGFCAENDEICAKMDGFWTRIRSARFDRVLMTVVGYLIQHPIGSRALVSTPGVMHSLATFLEAPTDEVRIETLNALTALAAGAISSLFSLDFPHFWLIFGDFVALFPSVGHLAVTDALASVRLPF